jgi:hypothetical protein
MNLYVIRSQNKNIPIPSYYTQYFKTDHIPLFWNDYKKDWDILYFAGLYTEEEKSSMELPEDGVWGEWISEANSY